MENNLLTVALQRPYLRGEHQAIVTDGEDIVRSEAEFHSLIACDDAAQDDVTVSVGRKPVRAVPLQLFAHLGCHSVRQAGLKRLVGKGRHLDRFFTGSKPIRWTQLVT